MQFKLKLFVREHRNGFFTLRVMGTPPLAVYTANLDDARQDLALVISDRIERTHPSIQSEHVTLGAEQHAELSVDALLPVLDASGTAAKTHMRFSVLLSERRAFQSLWFPRPDLHHWIPKKERAWEKAAREVLNKYFARLKAPEMLELRYERREWMEELIVDAEPPSLAAFTGKNRNLLELPPAHPKEEDEDEEENEEPEEEPKQAQPQKKKKKKRPDTPTLRKIGVHLSALAEDRELEHAHERTRELADLLRILQSPGEKAIVLVGKPGVGKSTLLSELVYRLRDPNIPAKLRKRPVWFADASRLVAGDGFFGDWQRQCLDVLAECEAAEVIWYIGALLPLLDAGKHIYSDHNVSLLLKPYLAAKRVTVIGEATEKDFARLEVRDAGFARTFTPYRIEEPPPEEAQRILDQVAAEISTEEDLEIPAPGRAAIFELCRRYVSDGSHLGAAIHFLRRTAEQMTARKERVLGRAEAVASFSRETGIPERMVRDDLPLDPRSVSDAFRGRLIGQEEAIRRMTDLIAVIKAGLSDLSRPLGSFLFVGPTGVGKTETAKALAHYLFGGEHRMARFDMSEFVGYDAVHRFLGDAKSEGKLVEAIRKRPFSVVLLDEIEKAHPAIFDVLLQVLGEARLTDESGRVADFRNAVIIMTSNLGVESFKHRAGFDRSAEMREHFLREAEKFFRPELFNRIDHIVPFAPLEAEAIGEITRRELDKFLAREGLKQRELTLELAPEVIAWLAERGVDPRYGARPLKRVLERALAIPLARQVSRAKGEATPVLEVRPDGESLAFVPGEERAAISTIPARGLRAGNAEVLTGLLERIDRTVFRVQRWRASTDYRDLAQELRLLDQLAQSKLFWANRELAEKRVAGSDVSREILSDWEKLSARAGGLEDLAYEAYHARDLEQRSMLEEELGKVETALVDLELRLYGRRFFAPNRAVLYLSPARGSKSFLFSLIELYAQLARLERWKLGVHLAVRPDAQDSSKTVAKTVGPPRNRAADGREKASTAAIRMVKRKTEDRLRQRVTWKLLSERDPTVEAQKPSKGPDDEEAAVRAWMHHQLQSLSDQTEVALTVDGRHAAAFLSEESGHHYHVEGNESFLVKVEYRNGADGFGLAHPADIPLRADRCRTLHEHRRLVEDHTLELHFPIEPRWYRIYRRFMRARMYRNIFGERGVTWFKTWEGS